MTPTLDRRVLRILDANFNRSREGLRVCEEVFRFLAEDPALARRLKKTRHGVTRVMKSLPVAYSVFLDARDVRGDSGKAPSRLEKKRRGVADLFYANIERVKESLRALEEFSKLADPRATDRFKKLRFEVYEIEKRAVPRLEDLRDNGQRRPSKKNTRRSRA